MTNRKLVRLYEEHAGKISDKWSLYFNEYDRILSPYRNKPVNLLEIGIQNGGSLEILAKYFPHAKKLVGCDINPDCSGLSYEDPRIAVVVGDANSDIAQIEILSYAPAFDVIIDDGSHRSSDIVKAFARYFPHLVDGGAFIAEDLHCSYWQEFEGGLFDPFSSISFFKRLADIANHEHWGIDKPGVDILSGFLSKYDFQIDEDALQHIHSVEFINSMCVIRKDRPARNSLGARAVVGSVGTVVPGNVLRSSLLGAPDQTSNEWAARSVPPDEELLRHIETGRDVGSADPNRPKPLQPRTYLRSSSGTYSESEASDGVALEKGERRFGFKLHLPPDQEIGFIRIDPDTNSGYFSIADVQIGRHRLAELSQRVVAASERLLRASEGAVMVCASGTDPWIELDIGDLGLTSRDCEAIEVSVAAHSVSSLLLEAYDSLIRINESDEAVRRMVAEGVATIRSELAGAQAANASALNGLAVNSDEAVRRTVAEGVATIRSELAGVHAGNASALNGMADNLLEFERRDSELRASFELLSEKVEASWQQANVALQETAVSILPLQEAVRGVHAVATAANVTLDALHVRAAEDRARYEEQLAAFAAGSAASLAEIRSAVDHQLAELAGLVRTESAAARRHDDALAAASAESLGEMRETIEEWRRASEKDREVAAMVLTWMQRRSFSYWWRRLFR